MKDPDREKQSTNQSNIVRAPIRRPSAEATADGHEQDDTGATRFNIVGIEEAKHSARPPKGSVEQVGNANKLGEGASAGRPPAGGALGGAVTEGRNDD